MEHIVIPIYTELHYEAFNTKDKIQDIYKTIVEDENRNNRIFDDVLKVLEEGRSPLILTERTAHVDYLYNKFKGFVKNIVVLKGGRSMKQKLKAEEQLKNIPKDEERLIIATGKYIGEGFDYYSL
jgi:hypothetical protein